MLRDSASLYTHSRWQLLQLAEYSPLNWNVQTTEVKKMPSHMTGTERLRTEHFYPEAIQSLHKHYTDFAHIHPSKLTHTS